MFKVLGARGVAARRLVLGYLNVQRFLSLVAIVVAAHLAIVVRHVLVVVTQRDHLRSAVQKGGALVVLGQGQGRRIFNNAVRLLVWLQVGHFLLLMLSISISLMPTIFSKAVWQHG